MGLSTVSEACMFFCLSYMQLSYEHSNQLIFYLLTSLYSVEIFVHHFDLLLSIKCYYYCTDWNIFWSACTDNRLSSVSYSFSTCPES